MSRRRLTVLPMPFSFLKKIKLAIRACSARNRAWEMSSSVGGRRHSPFQEAALEAIRQELGELAFCEEGERERYLVARKLNLTVYVFRDGAELQTTSQDRRFERWDYDSPSELIDALVKSAHEIEKIQGPLPIQGGHT